MIERLLAADRALSAGEVDAAERMYGQVVEADPRNAIAVVGLARVAEARGRHEDARALVERALAIDPEEALARRLRATFETASTRGEPPATTAGAASAPVNESPRRGGVIAWLRRLLRL